MDADEKWFIERLDDRKVSENDVYSSIDSLEMLLSVDALPALVRLVADDARAMPTRRRAAEAIANIGPTYVSSELAALKESGSPVIRDLVALAENQ